MDFDYSAAQKELREEIAAFCEAELNPGAAQRDRDAEFPRDLFARAGEQLRLQGLAVPEDLGGRGLDPLTTACVLEQFGYSCDDAGLVFSICAHLLASSVPIAAFATDEQKSRWFPALCDGSVVAVNGMTEPGAGSDINALQTRAVRDGDGGDWILNGHKALATNGPAGDVAVVFAVTDAEAPLSGRLTPFIVSMDSPGIEKLDAYRTMGHRTTPLGEFVLKDVRVDDSAILGGRTGTGMAMFNHAMNWERICLFAAHAGTMRRLLDIAIKRAKTRKQFDAPIGSFQGISHKIADMKVRTDAARLLTYHAASRLDVARDVALDASVVKTFVSEAWIDSARDLMQIHGGSGYLEQTGPERHLRDALGSTLYSGANEIQRNIITAWLGV